MEAMQVSIDRWIDKLNVPYTYVCVCVYIWNELLLSLVKEENSDMCYNMYEPWRHNGKWNESVIKAQILCDSTHMSLE